MLDDETRAELIEQVAAFRAVDETIKTIGWQKFVLPRFERLKQAHTHNLMSAQELPDVIRAQESIKAINMLLDDINLCIEEGKEAVKTLAEEKDEETQRATNTQN